jgi:hypothetical protein
MNKHKDVVFSTPHIEGKERACALIVAGNASFRAYRWARFSDHWLIETANGAQAEIYDIPMIINIPLSGWTFDLDGTYREVRSESMLVVN